MSEISPSRDLSPREANAVRTMSALAHPTRLRVYLDLLTALPGGRASGEIAAAVGAAATTMSAHLAVLSRAGLAHATRQGKSIVYAADPAPAHDLSAFLDKATSVTEERLGQRRPNR